LMLPRIPSKVLKKLAKSLTRIRKDRRTFDF
jgi:hypothetical protein